MRRFVVALSAAGLLMVGGCSPQGTAGGGAKAGVEALPGLLPVPADTAAGGGARGTVLTVPGVGTVGEVQPASAVAPEPEPEPVVEGYRRVLGTPLEALHAHADHAALPALARAARSFVREFWVSPSGSDTQAGTKERPFRTLGHAVSLLQPGDGLHVMAGEYAENLALRGAHGSAERPITLVGEGKPRLAPGGGTVVAFERRHWVMDGFEVDGRGAPAFAVTFAGDVEGARLTNSEVHSGSGGAGISVHGGATGVVVENNHVHGFSKGSDDAHGIVVQPTARRVTLRNNDIHDVSGDSIQCIGPEGYSEDPPAEGVVIEGNHLYGAQENGVDIKTCHQVQIRGNRMHGFRIAPANQGAKGDAIVVHLSARDVVVEGNELYDAGRGVSLGGVRMGPLPTNVVIRRNRIHDLVTEGGMEGLGIRVENSERAQVVHNTLTRLAGPAIVVGFGSGGPTQNAFVANNLVEAAKAVQVGPEAPGLRFANNLYLAQARFVRVGVELGLEGWRTALEQQALAASGSLTLGGAELLPAAGVDQGVEVGLPFCGAGPDVGASETGC